MLIGINGLKESGKDTIAGFLIERYGFQRYAFADRMKKAVYELNPYVLVSVKVGKLFNFSEGVEYIPYLKKCIIRIATLVDKIGWDEAKKEEEVRLILQRFGTQAGRNIHGDMVWVDLLFNQLESEGKVNFFYNYPDRGFYDSKIVITDVRFNNEAGKIKDFGGRVISIRSEVSASDSHESEQGIKPVLVDFYLDNPRILVDGQYVYTKPLDRVLEDLRQYLEKDIW